MVLLSAITMAVGLHLSPLVTTTTWSALSGPPRDRGRPTLTVNYQYDRLHRLIRATYSTGLEISYEYDAVGNRTSKLVTVNSR